MTFPHWQDWLACCFIILLTGTCDTSQNSSPSIKTKPQNLRLPKGDTAMLTCKVSNGVSMPLVWRRGYSVLATGVVMVSPDPRLSVQEHGGASSLTITSLKEEDAGQYVCQLSLLDGIISVQHNLDILVSASVTPVPLEGLSTIKEGEEAILQCSATGNPLPSITWTRQNGALPSHAHPACPRGECLSLPSVTREDDGQYSCTASNGVGGQSVAVLKLQVMFLPSIRVESESVTAGTGRKLVLTCQVEGQPTPSVIWFFGDKKVHPNAVTGISLSKSDTYHRLTVAQSDRHSFGNYSCVATNKLGTFKKYIEVHGRPTEATFLTSGMKSARNSFQLSWKVRSFVKIHEYRLLYRKLAEKGTKAQGGSSDWTNVIIPGREIFTPGLQVTNWRLDNLGEDSTYECLVQARNDYGWSQPSEMFTFSTSEKSFQSPATSGLNWGGSVTGGSCNNMIQSFFLLMGFTLVCLA